MMWLSVRFELDGENAATHVGMEIPEHAIPKGDLVTEGDVHNWHEAVTSKVFTEILRYVSSEMMLVAKYKHKNPRT